jgi:hypothetical protein
MRRLLTTMAAAIACSTPLAVGAQEPARTGWITGRVVDEQNRPIEDVFVAAWSRAAPTGQPPEGAAARTGPDGVYRMNEVAIGDYTVGVVVFRETMREPDPQAVSSCTVVAPPVPWSLADEIAAGLQRPPEPPRPTRPIGTLYTELSRPFTAPPPRADGTTMTYAPTYFPGVLSPASASVVTVRAGQTTSGIDLRFAPVPAGNVSGRVTGTYGKLGTIELHLRGSHVTGTVGRSGMQRDGTFTIPDVPPGPYTLKVALYDSATCDTMSTTIGEDLTAVPVDVPAGGLANLEVPMFRGYSVSGTFVFNGRAPHVNGARVTLRPLDHPRQWPPPIGSGTGATFTTTGALPGRYEVNVEPGNDLETWRLEKVTLDGRDVTAQAIVIGTSNLEGMVVTLTDRPATVQGAVRADRGGSPANTIVVLFPVDRATWTGAWPGLRFQSTRVARGTYFFPHVLNGEYFVAAADEGALKEWPSPATLEQLSARAQRVTISTGRAHFASLEVK